MTLVNWGFGAGDIAVMAGAGRAAGNWVMAQMKDRAPVDFLSLYIDAIMSRKGLLGISALHERWNKKLTLLQNLRPIWIEHPSGSATTVVNNLDRFTWFMLLVIGTLDAAITAQGLHIITSRFFAELFEESPAGVEYLHRELYQHIQGWRSSACVRGILQRARDVWEMLGELKKYLPNYSPAGDYQGVHRLLLWLAQGKGTSLSTASSDVFCITLVLREIGIEGLCCGGKSKELDESMLIVYFDDSLAIHQVSAKPPPRWGMRFRLPTRVRVHLARRSRNQ